MIWDSRYDILKTIVGECPQAVHNQWEFCREYGCSHYQWTQEIELDHGHFWYGDRTVSGKLDGIRYPDVIPVTVSNLDRDYAANFIDISYLLDRPNPLPIWIISAPTNMSSFKDFLVRRAKESSPIDLNSLPHTKRNSGFRFDAVNDTTKVQTVAVVNLMIDGAYRYKTPFMDHFVHVAPVQTKRMYTYATLREAPATVELGTSPTSRMAATSTDAAYIAYWHFKGWKDRNAPDSIQDVLNFCCHFLAWWLKHPVPVVVHCSAGVGRTGTWVCLISLIIALISDIDTMPKMKTLLQAVGGNGPRLLDAAAYNLYSRYAITIFILWYRWQRHPGFVQTKEQFGFLHQVAQFFLDDANVRMLKSMILF